MKDITGTEIQIGDILLNLRERCLDPWDAWAFLICDEKGDIRDFNAWNMGWFSDETLILDNAINPKTPYIDYIAEKIGYGSAAEIKDEYGFK